MCTISILRRERQQDSKFEASQDSTARACLRTSRAADAAEGWSTDASVMDTAVGSGSASVKEETNETNPSSCSRENRNHCNWQLHKSRGLCGTKHPILVAIFNNGM